MKKIKKSKTKKFKSKEKITKNMTFSEVLSKYPQSVNVMMDYGLHCIGCQVAAFETIEQGAKAHGITSKELNKMINELNKTAEKKEIIKEEKIEFPEPIKEPIKKKSFFKRLLGG